MARIHISLLVPLGASLALAQVCPAQDATTPPSSADGAATVEEAPASRPLPRPLTQASRVDIVNIDRGRYDDGVLYGEGHVEVIVHEPVTENEETRYETVRVTADALVYDHARDLVTFKGNVRVERENMAVQQDELEIQLDTKRAIGRGDVESRLDPELFGGPYPLEPLYVAARKIDVRQEQNEILVTDGRITSCNLDHPHYALGSRNIKVIPGKRMIVKRPAFRLFGKTVARLPWDLSVSLRQRRSRVVPSFGNSITEGWFLKLMVPYTSGPNQWGDFKWATTQKRGMGFGNEHFIVTDDQAAELFLYWEPQEDAFSARVHHIYDISSTLSTDTRLSLQTRSGFALQSSRSSDLNLIARNIDQDSRFEFGFRRNATSVGSNTSDRVTVNVRDRQEYGGGLSTDVNLNFRDTTTAFDWGNNREVQAGLIIEQRNPERPFDWKLRGEHRFDMGGTGIQFSNIERLPELTVRTSSDRLGLGFLAGLPTEATVSFGEFLDRARGGELNHIFRSDFQLDFRQKRFEVARDTEVTWRGGFRQSLYSDDTAQYVFATGVGIQQRYGDHWQSNLDWRLTEPHGFTPLRMDVAGLRNSGRISISRFSSDRRSRLVFDTGYDLARDRWHDAVMRGDFRVAPYTRADMSLGYSLDRDTWRPAVLRLQRTGPGRLNYGLSTRYDIEGSRIGRIRADVDWLVTPKWRLETLTGWNGISKRIDFSDIRVTRDLHCWTASLTYSKQQKMVMFNIGIKAFAVRRPPLGYGRRGESFDVSEGQYF